MSRYTRRPTELPEILPVESGGSFSQTASDARDTLGMLSLSELGQNNGVALLNQQSKLNKNIFQGLLPYGDCVSGPSTISVSTPTQYEITDFDSFTVYTVTTTSGTVVRNGNTITYTPTSVAGQGGFTLNGRDVNIMVVVPNPETPVISSPVNGSVGVGYQLDVLASAFVPQGGVYAHDSSDWVVATDPGFTNIVSQSIQDAINKTSWTVLNPSVSTTYYLRCRYRGSNGNYSAWSATVSYTTKASFAISDETAIIPNTFTSPENSFGRGVAISGDGKRIAINVGTQDKVVVYIKTAGSWVIEQEITKTPLTGTFGFSLDLNTDGSWLVVGSPQSNTGGQVNVYSRTNSVWTLNQTLFMTGQQAGDYFGADVSISGNGDRIAACALGKDISGFDRAGVVVLFHRSVNTWSQVAMLSDPNPKEVGEAGKKLTMSKDGLRVAFTSSDPRLNQPGLPGINDRVLVFAWTASWNIEATIEPPSTSVFTTGFGLGLSFNENATTLLIGEPFRSVSGVSRTGCFYTYARSGTSWSGGTATSIPYIVDSIDSRFGEEVQISMNGNRAYISDPTKPNPDAQNPSLRVGGVSIFEKSGNSWNYLRTIYGSYSNANGDFGRKISVSDFESAMAVSCPGSTYTSPGTTKGAVFVFG